MTLRISFGKGGKPAQWYLPGTEPDLLPEPNLSPPVADALTDGPYEPPWGSDVPTQLFGGLVTARSSDGGGFRFPAPHTFGVVGGWNSVKNAFARSDGPFPESMFFNGFVHVDVMVTSEWPAEGLGPSGSEIRITGAKRGNVVTGDFDDVITIAMLSNEAGWNNQFRIASGGGNDTVELYGLNLTPPPGGAPDPTYTSFVGTSGVWNTTGEWTTTFVDLGDGDDRFTGHGSADTVTGGAGNDVGRGGGGNDTWVLSGRREGYRIDVAGTDTRIIDIDPLDGDDGADDIRDFETIRFGDGTTLAIPQATGLPPVSLAAIAAGNGGFKLSGPDFGGSYYNGPRVAGLGDVNGDGLADLAVADLFRGSGGSPHGTAFVVFGKPDTAPVDLSAIPGAGTPIGFTIVGAEGVPLLDFSAAGDVNGDGLADMLVGSTEGAFVVYGKANGGTVDLADIAAGSSSDGFRIAGPAGIDFAAVAGAGDVNGDGLADLLLAPTSAGVEDEIAAWLVFGKADGAVVELADISAGIGSHGFAILPQVGIPAPAAFGNAVSAAGDVNGDGLADLLLTSFGSDSGFGQAASFVVFGKADTAAVGLSDIAQGGSTQGFEIRVDNNFPLMALAPAAAGDVNGDGLADLLLGTIQADQPAVLGGAYVVFGKADGGAIELAEIGGGASAAGFLILGPGRANLTGNEVSGAGDLDGDGLADLLIGSPRGGSLAYVVFGKADGAIVQLYGLEGSPSSQAFGIEAEAPGFRSFTTLAAAGDVNGDGLADFLVGDQPAGGAAYVVFGREDWLTQTAWGLAAGPEPTAPGTMVMALQASFGNGGKPTQWYLPGTDPAVLPNPDAADPVADALTDGPYSPNWDNDLLFGGLVAATTLAYAEEPEGPVIHTFDVTGGWNSVKNAFARSDQAEELWFDGFVQVDVALGGTGTSVVEILGAKRGNIVTGAGADVIVVRMLSNEAAWNNEFRISSGAGDDFVLLAGLDRDAAVAGGDPTYVSFVNTTGEWNTTGAWTKTFTDLGDGNDTFIGHGSDDTVTGGAGDDFGIGGDGIDTWVLSGTPDGYAFELGFDLYFVITDIDPSDGDDGTDRIFEFERIAFADGTVAPARGAIVALAQIAAGIGGFKILGKAANDRLGEAVALAGDLNGDGLSDLLLGAPGYDGSSAGAGYVVFGKADGATINLDEVATGTGTLGYKLAGDQAGDAAGAAVAGPGDLDGDGIPDLLVGAPNNGGTGAAYLVFGKGDGTTVLLGSLAPGSGVVLIGEAAGDEAGASVAAAGDVNGDGVPDLLIGAPSFDFDDPWQLRGDGIAYVVFGGALDGPIDLAEVGSPAGPAGFRILAEDQGNEAVPGSAAGTAVGGGGDVNGDGLADLLITATFTNDIRGTAYVVFGKPDNASVDLAEIAGGNSAMGFSINGFGYLFGISSVADAGDVNGDGLSDVLVGQLGAAFVVFGKQDGTSVDLADLTSGTSTQGFAIIGESGEMFGGGFGASVAGAGDVNGDGLADLLVSAPFGRDYGGDDPLSGPGPGAAFLVFGKADGAPVYLDDIGFLGRGSLGLKFIGEAIWDLPGGAVSAAGDVNGDGLADLLIGAPGHDSDGAIDSGAAYVIFGRQEWLA